MVQIGGGIVSDYSAQLADSFVPNKELVFFNRATRGDVATVIGDLMESDRGEATAARGLHRVNRSFRWTDRAAEMAAFVSQQ